MKKAMMFLVAMMMVSGMAFAMAKKPDPNTFNGCIQKPYTVCASNNPAQPWQDPAWKVCAEEIYDACRCQYRPDLVKYNTKPCA